MVEGPDSNTLYFSFLCISSFAIPPAHNLDRTSNQESTSSLDPSWEHCPRILILTFFLRSVFLTAHGSGWAGTRKHFKTAATTLILGMSFYITLAFNSVTIFQKCHYSTTSRIPSILIPRIERYRRVCWNQPAICGGATWKTPWETPGKVTRATFHVCTCSLCHSTFPVLSHGLPAGLGCSLWCCFVCPLTISQQIRAWLW